MASQPASSIGKALKFVTTGHVNHRLAKHPVEGMSCHFPHSLAIVRSVRNLAFIPPT